MPTSYRFIWDRDLDAPQGATSARLRAPWLVLVGSSCPSCGEKVDSAGQITHKCGESLDIVQSYPFLVLLVRYPLGYAVVRTDQWHQYLLKLPHPTATSSCVPISLIHGGPWVIWSGEGLPPTNWVNATRCPECLREHRGVAMNHTFRCDCKARLMPLSMATLESMAPDHVESLWDEQAFKISVCGYTLLLSTQTMPSSP